MIRKLPNQNQWRLYSRKIINGKRKILGTFLSYEDAVKRERQIQYFKHKVKNPRKTKSKSTN